MKGEQLDAGAHWTGNPARPIHAPGQAPAATDETYIEALLARINALEMRIDELTPTRTPRPATRLLAAALALLAVAGGATATAHPGLSTALPSAWHTLMAGLTPAAPPMPGPSAEADDAADPPPSVSPVATPAARNHLTQRSRSHVLQPRPVAVRKAPAVPPVAPAATSQAQAEAAVRQAQAELKALKGAQKKSKTAKSARNTS